MINRILNQTKSKNVENCLKAVALLVTISMFFKGIIDVDKSWDTWNYHLPFAARIWGIVPAQFYTFEDGTEYRFEGFPLFGEFLQGFFWFIFQRPQAANLVSFLSLAFYFYFLKNYFKIPFYQSAIALLAVPLVHIHATSSYVDLPENIWISILIMMAYLLYVTKDFSTFFTKRNVSVILVSAACAANTKLLTVPIVVVIVCFIGYKFIALYFQQNREINFSLTGWLTILPTTCLVAVLIFATPIKNTIFYGNPFYPVKVEIANVVLNYREDLPTTIVPTYLKKAPQYQRWAHSILGINIFKERRLRRWTIDQVTELNSPTDRMGGFCAVYVIFNLVLLAYLFCRHRCRETWVALILVIVMSAITSIMPQSNELRYYIYWMISLVSLNLYLVSHLEPFDPGKLRIVSTRNIGLASLLILVVVIATTKAMYVLPQFNTLEKHLSHNVNEKLLKRIHEGDKVCIVGKQPKTFLYASIFHPPLNYSVKAASSVKECSIGKVISLTKEMSMS